MRELPINDLDWLKENVEVDVSLYKYYICRVNIHFKNIRRLCTDNQLSFNHVMVVINDMTGELFRFDDSYLSKNKLLNNLLKCDMFDENDLNYMHYCRNHISLRISMDEYIVRDKNFDSDINTIMDSFYKTHHIDITKLDTSCLSIFRHYTRSFIRKEINEMKAQENITSILIKYTKTKECCYLDHITNNLNVTYYDYSNIINKKLEEKLDNIRVKYLLLRSDTKFSGAATQIKFLRYKNNKKENTFDIIEIQIMMMADYQENLAFIKANPEKVTTLLKEIVEHHSRSSKYANYLKLYDLVLTRGNILVAKFCFKDGLEELCKGGN